MVMVFSYCTRVLTSDGYYPRLFVSLQVTAGLRVKLASVYQKLTGFSNHFVSVQHQCRFASYAEMGI